ncbi:MAG: membrane lipoprotein lipid attachment site-containing protein [Acidobacteria bacterium]|nr:membrane lipoprotein lipid attachment site-containing protein [Acidobacteriota bacterium]
MKKILLVITAAFLLGGCGASPDISKRPIENSEKTSGPENETVAAHSVEKDKEKLNLPKIQTVESSKEKSAWTRSGDPIDTKGFDESIAAAEKAVKADPNNAAAKTALADAFYKRGFALTEARQYAAAIGDYRAALKYQPEHEDAKKWIATITGIYNSMNREIPKEGEEPKALEFKKDKS